MSPDCTCGCPGGRHRSEPPYSCMDCGCAAFALPGEPSPAPPTEREEREEEDELLHGASCAADLIEEQDLQAAEYVRILIARLRTHFPSDQDSDLKLDERPASYWKARYIEARQEVQGLRTHSPEEPVDVVAAVRRDDDGMVWLCKRNSDGDHAGLAGMWEYPGGKVEDGEQLRDALVRELLEEFPNCVVNVGRVLDSITSVYDCTAYRVTFFEVAMSQVTAHPTHEKVGWFTPDEACALDHLPSGTVFNARHLASPEEPDDVVCSTCGERRPRDPVGIRGRPEEGVGYMAFREFGGVLVPMHGFVTNDTETLRQLIEMQTGFECAVHPIGQPLDNRSGS